MRWIWIDKFVEFTSRQSATAVKSTTLAEEHLHDLFPEFPIVPHSLIVEGMAQTSGMVVGEARDFKEKVILAKIAKATFHRLVRPGDTMVFIATVEQMNEQGASINGRVEIAPATAIGLKPAPGTPILVAEIELMFSHIDQNSQGIKFPENNFVFTSGFVRLLDNYRNGLGMTL